jgi:alkylation response protein AidB-like acyl-CoA dehydrogenase
MHFDLTEDQKAIRDATADALRGLLPTDRLVALLDESGLNASTWRQLIDLGLPATLVPTEHDGLGLDLVTLATIAEQLGYAAAPAPAVSNALAAWAVAVSGSSAQREKWLKGLVDGSIVAAVAVSDEDARLEADSATWTARLRLVEWGSVASVLLCRTNDDGLALIDLTQSGVNKAAVDSVDRTRPLADIDLQEVKVSRIPGSDPVGIRLRDASLVLSAANAFGSAMRALDMSVTYANERKQFDQLIGSFQGLKHQIANVTAELLPCRPLYWYAAHAWDAIPKDASRAAAIAKAHVTDVAVRSARLAVEFHGGIGYTWEYPLHVFLKRAMYDRTHLGLPMVHRERAAVLAGW